MKNWMTFSSICDIRTFNKMFRQLWISLYKFPYYISNIGMTLLVRVCYFSTICQNFHIISNLFIPRTKKTALKQSLYINTYKYIIISALKFSTRYRWSSIIIFYNQIINRFLCPPHRITVYPICRILCGFYRTISFRR